MRTESKISATAVVALSLASLFGCGSNEHNGKPTQAGGETATLTITVDQGRQGKAEGRLSCGPGGDRKTGELSASPTALCKAAFHLASFLTREPNTKRACTQIYGGPQTARVSGKIAGRSVDRRFTRTDGCQISDWDHTIPLLPPQS